MHSIKWGEVYHVIFLFIYKLPTFSLKKRIKNCLKTIYLDTSIKTTSRNLPNNYFFLFIILYQNKPLPPNYNVVSNKVFHSISVLNDKYILVHVLSITKLSYTFKGHVWSDDYMNKNIIFYLGHIEFTFDCIFQSCDCKKQAIWFCFIVQEVWFIIQTMSHYIWAQYWTHYKTSFLWAKYR